ncbi:MAG: tRNA modification GTPase [Pirellulales bacterium]
MGNGASAIEGEHDFWHNPRIAASTRKLPIDLDTTIAAIASPPGGAARGIVRLSGPNVIACVQQLFAATDGRDLAGIQRPTAVAGQLALPGLFSPLPCRLLLWPTASSYTRQPTAELHAPGSPPLLAHLLECLCSAGAVLARPGEFTLRAFLAGRIDLTQAEAVLGVIDADSRHALDSALRQLAGGLGQPLAALREELLNLLADLEAGLDFVDEDLDFLDRDLLADRLHAAHDHVAGAARQLAVRGEVRDVVKAVLTGPPNAGKSSLFNALAGGERALVSPIAGTTTDYLACDLNLDGVACRLIDTAGHDLQPVHGVPRLAQQFRQQQQQQADVAVLCQEAGGSTPGWPLDESFLNESAAAVSLRVWTKCDQPNVLEPDPRTAVEQSHPLPLATSAVRGDGLAELRQALRRACQEVQSSRSTGVAATAARCHESLRLAAAALCQASELVATSAGDELMAAEIRLALDELGHVVGAIYTDDLLDRIFSRFCIGK